MAKLSPWDVVGALPQRPTQPCPECTHGVLEIVEATIVESYHSGYHVADRPLPVRERACVAAACNGCEFVIEVKL